MDTLKTQSHRPRQQGFVLVISLVIMVVMTLSAVAMITSLRGGISASGNISFRQAATRAADVASDSAYQWVQAQIAVPTGLDSDIEPLDAAAATTTARYYATLVGADIACKKDGVADAFTPQSYRFSDTALDADGAPCASKIAGKPSGYDIYYVVHRMAVTAGLSCPAAQCVSPPVTIVSTPLAAGTSRDSTTAQFGNASGTSSGAVVYYRITVKVSGPRQNNRYVQAFVY
ncbi:MAG: hypothetical protein IPP41_03695 [Rhodocyclaceae bacterium]|nr:hypothetical protein [Rhodocyclaceae bacterium]